MQGGRRRRSRSRSRRRSKEEEQGVQGLYQRGRDSCDCGASKWIRTGKVRKTISTTSTHGHKKYCEGAAKFSVTCALDYRERCSSNMAMQGGG